MKNPIIIRIAYGQGVIQLVSLISAMNINMHPVDIKRLVQMKYLPKCKAISHGGEPTFSYHNRCYLAHGTVFSHRYWSIFLESLCKWIHSSLPIVRYITTTRFVCFIYRFLRSGYIVAQAGIFSGILIIFATVSLALISVLAAVDICERCRVESGGVYFLIAHTLGSRFGGSLGLLYCFGQAVGCALNVMGMFCPLLIWHSLFFIY